MHKIAITIGEYEIHAELLNTATSKAISKCLPFDSAAQTWGDEIYFTTPLQNISIEANAKDVVEAGELAFWVEGNCIAIGFGPTPISQRNEIRLAAKTNIWAHTNDDLTILKNVSAGDHITVAEIKS